MVDDPTVRLDMRLPATEKASWEETARVEGKTLTQWLRDLANVEVAKSYWRRRRIELLEPSPRRT